jgi:hypothetical protein
VHNPGGFLSALVRSTVDHALAEAGRPDTVGEDPPGDSIQG